MLFEHYKALWRQIESEGVHVRYAQGGRGEDGYFWHDGNPIRSPDGVWTQGPLIAICRAFQMTHDDEPSERGADGQAVALEAELFTLAHEYGHCLSFQGRTPRDAWEAYHRAAGHRDQIYDAIPDGGSVPAALGAGLSEGEKSLIMAEETLAWDLGRVFVPEALRTPYDSGAAHGLYCHRYRMGMLAQSGLSHPTPPAP
jgi:hypothetical protein